MKEAIENTFKERKTEYYLEKIEKQIQDIENSNDLKKIWENYKNKFLYATDISYQDVMDAIKEIEEIVK